MPHKCRRAYRRVVLRKNVSVQKGEEALFDEIRYFFYLTNPVPSRYGPEAIVWLPAPIVRRGRRIIYRLLGYNAWLKDFFGLGERLRRMAPA